MSFITKRERVFNDYDQYELPARNEGKLKTYSSCTDTRAWSHSGSDKAEHLVDIIKRNNQICRAKYVPTDVIVNTLMAAKNAEISRLKRRVEEFEQMVAAYDQLELTWDQKCEIANAHAAIKQANKELDDLFINLDMSNYTEGLDSGRYETGQSSEMPGNGDEWRRSKRDEENQCVSRSEMFCKDSSTNVTDPRIEEMQEELICKDARLNALQNIKAILENDICEPYCIYAHIYTALEKIFAILCQNDKYKIYLTLMGSRRDSRCADIKGKIIYKLHVLENFNSTLVSPTSYELFPKWQQEFLKNENSDYNCENNHEHTETAYSLSAVESRPIASDRKRAKLVADIMDEDEIGKVVITDNSKYKQSFVDLIEDYDIDNENLKRLKALQLSYDELVQCHESIKHDRDRLQIKCNKVEELEKECIDLRNQLREYNSLWNEKEHYRRRSEELDKLKEQYLVLAEEASSVETKLKAESEINHMRSKTIEELRNLNITLEKKLNEVSLVYEKEKNSLLCQLKETQCQIMCQEQQIKSLSSQIDRLIDQDRDVNKEEDTTKTLVLLEEVETLKDQIRSFKELLFCSEEEKQRLQSELLEKRKRIDDLKTQVENWKSSFDNTLEDNEQYSKDFRKQIQALVDENRQQKQDSDEKNAVISDLMAVITEKSKEINKLLKEIADKKKENEQLVKQIQKTVTNTNNSEMQISDSVQLEQFHESLQKNAQNKHSDLNQQVDYAKLKKILVEKETQIEKLHNELRLQLTTNDCLQQDISKLKKEKQCAIDDIKRLKEEKNKLEIELQNFQSMPETCSNFSRPNNEMIGSIHQPECIDSKYNNLKEAFDKTLSEKLTLENEIVQLHGEISNLSEMLQNFKKQNETLNNNSERLIELEVEVKNSKSKFEDINEQKMKLLEKYDKKIEEFNDLRRDFENKVEENNSLTLQLKYERQNLATLEAELAKSKAMTTAVEKKTEILNEKLKDYESLAEEFRKLNEIHLQVKHEKDALHKELERHLDDLKYLETEKNRLFSFKNNLETTEDLMASTQSEENECQQQYFPYSYILKEINTLRNEKEESQKRIHNLLESFERSEQIIANLSEDLAARDDKIAILQNHINALEAEVRRLHDNLESMINTGEQMKESYHKISESLEIMETQHVKATNSVKTELAKLKEENSKLKNQLLLASVKCDVTSKDISKYESQILNLQNENDQIVDTIKKLEIEITGHSSLINENRNTELVLESLDKLSTWLNKTKLKSNLWEQAINKVQNSSELLLMKADEAKKIIEREKHKAMAEKEEAIAAKVNMETQLNDLKNQLNEQARRDEIKIKDLEAEIMNQQLIIDKINKSKQSHIAEIEQEMNNLQNLYQNALLKISVLESENHQYVIEKSEVSQLIKNLKEDVERKKEEIRDIQKSIKVLSTTESRSTQAGVIGNCSSMCCQTEKYSNNKDFKNTETQTCVDEISQQMYSQTDVTEINDEKEDSDTVSINIMKLGHPPKEENRPVKDLFKPIKNEVQILSFSVEPAFDFVRNSYTNYKLNRLSVGNLEQYSISCVSVTHTNTDREIFEKEMYDTRFALDVDEDQTDQIMKSKSNNKLCTLIVSSSLNSVSNSEGKKTGSTSEEEFFVIYEDSNDSQTSERYKNGTLEKTSASYTQGEHINVSTSIYEKKSLSLEKMQEDNSRNSKENRTEGRIFENSDQETIEAKPSDYEISRIPANYLLIQKYNEIEHDLNNSKCIGTLEESKPKEIPNRFKKRRFMKKCLSDNFLTPIVNYIDEAVLVKIDSTLEFENKIKSLTIALENIEKDYKLKLDAVKTQYDANIRNMIKEHNEGIKCMQSLHEETMQEIMMSHETEIDILRSMSLEAMRKAEKLEQEYLALKKKIQYVDDEPVKMASSTNRRLRRDTAFLTKTNVEAFNVRPKKNRGPCPCCAGPKLTSEVRTSLQFNDPEKKKQVEQRVLNEIVNKITDGNNIENLDKQELLFLHTKVCRQWKKRNVRHDSIAKKMNVLENEMISKQRSAQEHIDELNRKVAEERRRLHEVRELVFSPRSASSAINGQEELFGLETTVKYEIGPDRDTEIYCALDMFVDDDPNTSYQDTVPERNIKDERSSTKNEYGELPTRLRKGKSPSQPRVVKKWSADRK